MVFQPMSSLSAINISFSLGLGIPGGKLGGGGLEDGMGVKVGVKAGEFLALQSLYLSALLPTLWRTGKVFNF